MPEPDAALVQPQEKTAPPEHSGPMRDASERPPTCLVVRYRYVHDDDPLPRQGRPGGSRAFAALSRAGFEAQIDMLCRSMEPIDWPTFFAWTDGRAAIPPRSFLLTFDDGLADHARHVLPILQRRGLRGVFFIPGAVLTSHCLLPAHAIDLLRAALGEATLEQELLAYREQHRESSAAGQRPADRDRDPAANPFEIPDRARLEPWLTFDLPSTIRNQTVRTLFERHIGSMTRWARHWYLDWDDVVEMESSGHTLGVHGFAHEPLTRLSPAELRKDLHRAASVLYNGLGPDVRPLSYPYGRFDAETCAACRDEGFAQGFTTEERLASAGDDPFRVPRVDASRLEAALQGGILAAWP